MAYAKINSGLLEQISRSRFSSCLNVSGNLVRITIMVIFSFSPFKVIDGLSKVTPDGGGQRTSYCPLYSES